MSRLTAAAILMIALGVAAHSGGMPARTQGERTAAKPKNAVRNSLLRQRKESAYVHITGSGSANCGGNNVSPLGAWPNPWTGGTVEQCKAKCTADPTCNAFVRRDSDGACGWKSGVTQSTIVRDYSKPGHSCYLSLSGHTAAPPQLPPIDGDWTTTSYSPNDPAFSSQIGATNTIDGSSSRITWHGSNSASRGPFSIVRETTEDGAQQYVMYKGVYAASSTFCKGVLRRSDVSVDENTLSWHFVIEEADFTFVWTRTTTTTTTNTTTTTKPTTGTDRACTCECACGKGTVYSNVTMACEASGVSSESGDAGECESTQDWAVALMIVFLLIAIAEFAYIVYVTQRTTQPEEAGAESAIDVFSAWRRDDTAAEDALGAATTTTTKTATTTNITAVSADALYDSATAHLVDAARRVQRERKGENTLGGFSEENSSSDEDELDLN